LERKEADQRGRDREHDGAVDACCCEGACHLLLLAAFHQEGLKRTGAIGRRQPGHEGEQNQDCHRRMAGRAETDEGRRADEQASGQLETRPQKIRQDRGQGSPDQFAEHEDPA
jgi:hypothetical protein